MGRKNPRYMSLEGLNALNQAYQQETAGTTGTGKKTVQKYIYTTRSGESIKLDHELSFYEQVDLYPYAAMTALKALVIFCIAMTACAAAYAILPQMMPQFYPVSTAGSVILMIITIVSTAVLLYVSYGKLAWLILYEAVCLYYTFWLCPAAGAYGVYPMTYRVFEPAVFTANLVTLRIYLIIQLIMLACYYVFMLCLIFTKAREDKIPRAWQKNYLFRRLAKISYGKEQYDALIAEERSHGPTKEQAKALRSRMQFIAIVNEPVESDETAETSDAAREIYPDDERTE